MIPAEARAKRIRKVMWVTFGFAMLGYSAVSVLADPRYAAVVAACAIIPIGATAPTVIKGVLRGAGLGLLAGVGIYAGLTYGRKVEPEALRQITLKAILGTMVLCAAVAAVFAFLARARRERIERQWRQ